MAPKPMPKVSFKYLKIAQLQELHQQYQVKRDSLRAVVLPWNSDTWSEAEWDIAWGVSGCDNEMHKIEQEIKKRHEATQRSTGNGE